MKRIPALVIAALFSLSAFSVWAASPDIDGAQPGVWTQDYDAALKLAAEKKLPILLNFTGSDWCGWCKLMDRQVFSDEAWKTWAKDKLIMVFIDFPGNPALVPEKYKKRNSELQRKYGVRGYPTYIVVARDGTSVLGQLGASRDANAADFIGKVKKLIPAE